ncbi:MAG: phosphatase PAP2 family protein [Ruminococcus sp.]|jgi:membrane-associated phospholipid phosphatase|nr:phosphatase PAP2 family protein [Ruminococcus sp.]
MTEQRYKIIIDWFNSHERALKALKIIYKYLSYPVYVAYPLLLIYVFLKVRDGVYEPAVFYKELLIPAFTLAAVTAIRDFLNKPRPYERMNITPLISKKTEGHSFPSRHSASVFIIAMAFLYINIWFGIVFFIIGIIMCLSRVLAGVHYERDVVCGALFSVIFGLLFYTSYPDSFFNSLYNIFNIF